MRIGFLTHEPFYPPSGGGSAEAVYLVRELIARGHETHVFCPAFENSSGIATDFGIILHEFKRWPMGRYARLRNLKYLLYPSVVTRMVEQAAASVTFDALLAQHTISAVAGARLRRRLRVPVVLNFLDYLSGFMEAWPAWAVPPPVVRALNRYEMALPLRYGVEGILTVSSVLGDRFAATGYPRERICPIHYGYDADLFKPASPDSVAVSRGQEVVVMHGSFDHHHLGQIALETVTRTTTARPGVEFRFVGRETPALQSFVQRVRRRSPAARLTLTGFKPYSEVARQLQTASLGIVPYEESNGTHCAFVAKMVEYLGCGIPAVSTPLENLRRYFAQEHAVRFVKFDGGSFSDAILGWLDIAPLERRRLGVEASERVRMELDWPVVARRAIDFVERSAQRFS